MSEQKIQMVAMVAEGSATAEAIDPQQLLQAHLMRRYALQGQRIETAFMVALMATLGVVIALVIFSLINAGRLPEDYVLFAQFQEWRSDETTQYPVCEWRCEIVTQAKRILAAASQTGESIIAEDGRGNVAGFARLCTLIAVSISVAFVYRRQLAARYEINAQLAQLEDFEEMPGWQRWLNRILYTFSALFGVYVVVSIIWLGLSLIFKNMVLDWPSTVLVVALFTSTMTFVAAFGALAVTTRDILALGLFVFLAGFSVSFALAPILGDGSQWWQSAVSNAGQLNPSAPLFTATLASASLALIVMWFDIDSLIGQMIDDGDVRLLSSEQWLWVARLLYAMLIVGLLFVGFIRVDDINHPFNKVFHAGGSVFAIASIVIAGLLIRKRNFYPWYRLFSVHGLVGLTLGMAILGSLKLDPLSVVFVGTGLISLTVIELALFILIGLWVFVTVDNLLSQANIQALKGQVFVAMASSEFKG